MAVAGCLTVTASAMDVPAGWDLTFAAQRTEAPPIQPGFDLYRTIDQTGWQIRYFLQQVPLERADEAVFVQNHGNNRFGLFIEGEHAWLLRNLDYSSVEIRAVNLGEARKIIRRYARRDGPTRRASFQFTENPTCSAEVARAAVSTYVKGKAKQYWLSGADFCEIDTELLSPLKLIMCGGHCRTTKPVSLWAERLEEELQALAPLDRRAAMSGRDRDTALRHAKELLANGGTTEAMCQALNELMSLTSPTDKMRVRDFKHPDDDVDSAMVALVGRVDTRCTFKNGAPLLEYLVSRSATAVVEAALKAGFPVNEGEHRTPLEVAISEKREDVQQILIRAGGMRNTTLEK